MNAEERQKILYGLAGIDVRADSMPTPEEFFGATLLAPAQLNALDPEIMLIIGGRGVGKSHIFRILELASDSKLCNPGKWRKRLVGAHWLPAFSTSAIPLLKHRFQFPAKDVLQRFAVGKSRRELVMFWWGSLTGAMLSHGDPAFHSPFLRFLPANVCNMVSSHVDEPSIWHGVMMKHTEALERAWGALDGELVQQRRFLFASYDDLDVMAEEWAEKRALLQALFRLWVGEFRNFARIRPKIMLPRILYSADVLQSSDALKWDTCKVDIRWTSEDVYHLVVKRWANQNEASRRFIAVTGGISFVDDPIWGHTFAGDNRPERDTIKRIVHAIIGDFMGRGDLSGRPFEWIPDHLRDAKDEVVPQSMLNLFAIAARDELAHARAASGVLLSPQSIREAMSVVSERRIQEWTETYPWIHSVQDRLRGENVPLNRKELTGLLAELPRDLKSGIHRVNPTTDELVDDLLDFGILRQTPNESIHVPDLYLQGLGMTRTGSRGDPGYDFAICNARGQVVAWVEAKRRMKTTFKWARQWHRALMERMGSAPVRVHIVLVASDRIYVWNPEADVLADPDKLVNDDDSLLRSYFSSRDMSVEKSTPQEFEKIVGLWLEELVMSGRANPLLGVEGGVSVVHTDTL
jgi:hypothetical protein